MTIELRNPTKYSTSTCALLRAGRWPAFVAALVVAMPSAKAGPIVAVAPTAYAPVEPGPAPVEATPAAAPGQAAPTEPAPAPAAPSAALEAPASSGPREDPVAAARMVGTEMLGASAYFLGYGATVSGMATLYRDGGPYSAPGIEIGLLVGGVINLGVGGILLVMSRPRLNATDAWLDARPGRRAKFTAKARRRGLYLHDGVVDGATEGVVHKGRRLGMGGLFIVMGGGVLNGVGVGVSPLSPGAGFALALTGTAAMIGGAIVAARGKKMTFRPRDYLAAGSVALAPTILTTPEGQRLPGLSLAARW